jgi:hypothetical protein
VATPLSITKNISTNARQVADFFKEIILDIKPGLSKSGYLYYKRLGLISRQISVDIIFKAVSSVGSTNFLVEILNKPSTFL